MESGRICFFGILVKSQFSLMYDILDFMLFMWLWLLYAWCEILVGLGFCCDLWFMV